MIPRDFRLQLIERERQLRAQPTRAESLLWERLRKRQLGGFRFRRQHVIHTFIVDFYYPQARLIIEVDGGIHNDQKGYNNKGTAILEMLGYAILRFRNEKVEQCMAEVLVSIEDSCLRITAEFDKEGSDAHQTH